MERPAGLKKSRRFVWGIVVVVIIATLAGSFLLYLFYTRSSASAELTDPADDVTVNVGEGYPGVIDVVRSSLEAEGESLNITIELKDSLAGLGEGEFAQYNVTIVLENSDLKAYEVCAELNSTQMLGYVVELGGSDATPCQTEYSEKLLSLRVSLSDLPSAKRIRWFVLTSFEKFINDELVLDGTDLAPDENLQETVL